MRDYPNMSYCMAQNTLAAMNQILDAMREEGPMFLREMDADELRAYRKLFDACEEFLTATEDLDEQAYEESDLDGQPDEAQEWADFDQDC